METSEQTPQRRTSSVSAEAIIGVGVTIGALGVLCLLLGWAQWMRLEREVAMIFLPLGAVLVVGGAIGAFTGHARKRR